MITGGRPAPARAHPATGRKLAAGRLRRLAAAARDADEVREAVFRVAPDPIVISGPDGLVRDANAAAENLFGWPAPGLVGRWMSDLVAEPDAAAVPRAPCGKMLGSFGERAVLEGIGANGTRFPAEVTVRRVGVGRRAHFAAFIRDLSADRRAAATAAAQREHLAEIEKLSAMGSLLSGVAHEINNPLAIVAAQAAVLRERALDGDVARRADRIHAAAQRAGRIVKSFAALATRRPAVREPLPLAEAFAEARDLVAYGLRRADVTLTATFPDDLPPVAGDRDLIVQAFTALLLNAGEALAARDCHRRIAVRAMLGEAGVTVEVADNGPGVAAAVASRLFEPYVTTKPPGSGLGIGLSLCRSVLDQHGGTVAHRSDSDGATFTLVLPIALASPEARREVVRANLRVLVVDDEVEVARSLAELIEVLGHGAEVATSADEALARLELTTFDMVFTDVHMPGLDGAALRNRIAARRPALAGRTVLVTGDKRHGAGPGPDGATVLHKPFTAADVSALLARQAVP